MLVTHDERIALRAHRVIHMRDGQIEREVVNAIHNETLIANV